MACASFRIFFDPLKMWFLVSGKTLIFETFFFFFFLMIDTSTTLISLISFSYTSIFIVISEFLNEITQSVILNFLNFWHPNFLAFYVIALFTINTSLCKLLKVSIVNNCVISHWGKMPNRYLLSFLGAYITSGLGKYFKGEKWEKKFTSYFFVWFFLMDKISYTQFIFLNFIHKETSTLRSYSPSIINEPIYLGQL